MTTLDQSTRLDAAGIDETVDAVADYLAGENYRHDDALRLRLALDTMLVAWRDAGLDGNECAVSAERHMMRRTLDVSVRNVTPEIRERIERNDDSDGFFAQVVNSMGVDWAVSYEGTSVHAQVPLPRKRVKGAVSTLLAIGLAIAVHFLLFLLPLFIFLATLRLLGSIEFVKVPPFIYAFFAAIAAMTAFSAICFMLAHLKSRKGYHALLRACNPGAVIAFVTTSSAAAYWTCDTHMKEDLKVDRAFVDFALPLGIPLYQPGYAQYLLCLVAFVIAYQGDMLTLETLLIAVVSCTLLGVATPPVPGGMLMVYTALFTQMSFGLEPLALIVSVDLVADAVCTSSKMLTLPLQILLASCKEEKKEGQKTHAVHD